MNTIFPASSDPNFWSEFLRAARALWHSANHQVREGAQCAAYGIIGAFALLMIAAMSGSGFFVSTVALVMLAAGTFCSQDLGNSRWIFSSGVA
ncbi:MAG: hypothetical protein HYW65_00005 [Candidatus Liptonbacteria bacterium]|nr:hypothetical protein [Candidatus Liptonbacteria bacterium]